MIDLNNKLATVNNVSDFLGYDIIGDENILHAENLIQYASDYITNYTYNSFPVASEIDTPRLFTPKCSNQLWFQFPFKFNTTDTNFQIEVKDKFAGTVKYTFTTDDIYDSTVTEYPNGYITFYDKQDEVIDKSNAGEYEVYSIIFEKNILPVSEPNSVSITGYFGYKTVPADITQACVFIVADSMKERQRTKADESTLTEDGLTISFNPLASKNTMIRKILDKYRLTPLLY